MSYITEVLKYDRIREFYMIFAFEYFVNQNSQTILQKENSSVLIA